MLVRTQSCTLRGEQPLHPLSEIATGLKEMLLSQCLGPRRFGILVFYEVGGRGKKKAQVGFEVLSSGFGA